jgi:outer membrane protein assembly factor BamB
MKFISMPKTPFTLILFSGVLFSACQKDDLPASDKQVLSFKLESIDANRISVKIETDSIMVSVPGNVDLSSLTPSVTFKGASISPASGIQQDFNVVKDYTVTADDGTKKIYHVKVQRRDALYIGGLVQLLALDTRDGSLLWKDSLNEGFAYSNPLLRENILYCGSTQGNMYAFNARNGNVIWKKFLSATGIESPATAEGNMLYVGTNDDYFIALNAITGERIWEFKTGANVSTKAVIFNNTIIFGSSDGYVYSLDKATGSPVWKYFAGDVIVASSPILSNGKIFIGSRNNLIHSIDAATGIKNWTLNTGVSMEQSIPVVAGGIVYAAGWYGDFQQAGSVYAIDEQTGTLKWHTLDSVGFSGPLTIYNGILYVSGDDNNFHAISAATGESVWSVQILPNGSGAAIKNGIVYVGGGGTGYIYALDALTGQQKWKYPIPHDVLTSDPAIGRKQKNTAPSVSLQ